MLSPQRLAANRLNAQKSTGPRTPTGKSASSANGLKTGIHSNRLLLATEDPNGLAVLTSGWHSFYPNATPAESSLVEILIHSDWLLCRLACIEHGLKAAEAAFALHSAVDTPCSLQIGHKLRSRELRAAATRNDQFHQIARRREALMKAFYNAENELMELRAAREFGPADTAELQENIPSGAESASFIRMTVSPEVSEPVAEL